MMTDCEFYFEKKSLLSFFIFINYNMAGFDFYSEKLHWFPFLVFFINCMMIGCEFYFEKLHWFPFLFLV